MKSIHVVNLKKNKKLKKLIMKLLDVAYCWSGFSGGLCGQLLPRSLAFGGFACSLLGSCISEINSYKK